MLKIIKEIQRIKKRKNTVENVSRAFPQICIYPGHKEKIQWKMFSRAFPKYAFIQDTLSRTKIKSRIFQDQWPPWKRQVEVENILMANTRLHLLFTLITFFLCNLRQTSPNIKKKKQIPKKHFLTTLKKGGFQVNRSIKSHGVV